jgi:hypothetical protein
MHENIPPPLPPRTRLKLLSLRALLSIFICQMVILTVAVWRLGDKLERIDVRVKVQLDGTNR